MLRTLHPPALLLLAGLLAYPAPSASQQLSEPTRWLQNYLRIDSSTPAGEARATSYLADILHREGIATQRLVSPAGHTSLYARLEADEPGGGEEAGPLVLLHHLDVVPAGEGWRFPPFAGEVRDGRLLGRGAIDVKSLGVAHLAAFLDLARRDVPLERDVVFLAVADEERGGLQGTGWLLERHAELLEGAWAVYGEGGANRTVNRREIWAGIEVAQKRPLWLRVSARGRPGHGSGYNPSSAVHELIAGLDRAIALPKRWRVTEAARLHLRALAPLHNERYREVFTDLDRFIEPEGPTVELMPGIANLFVDSFQVTVLEGGEKINVVPARAYAEIDVRLLPETDAGAYLERIEEALGEDVDVEVLLTSPPAPPSPVDHPAYRAAARVLDDTAPVVPAFIPGFTDSRFFRSRGIPAYGVSPFFLEALDFRGVHGPDEAIPVVELERGVERMKRIVARAVAATP